MNFYRLSSLCMMVTFIAVGLLFFLLPDGVLSFFNAISGQLGMKEILLQGKSFFLILATAYMYIVSLLAFFMFKYPDNQFPPLLLANAKLASSLLSFGMFFYHQPYLIYLVNGLVDGAIGVFVLFLYLRMRKEPA